MPNWCENRVAISGEPNEIKAFREAAFKDGKFQFKNLIPMPGELDITSGSLGKGTVAQAELEIKQEQNIQKHGYKNWYDWSNSIWGTKWDIEAEDMSDDNEFITLQFDTAWSPPEGVYEYIKANFPSLDVSWFYDEPGMEFAGYLGE
jgi:hypothetical protein